MSIDPTKKKDFVRWGNYERKRLKIETVPSQPLYNFFNIISCLSGGQKFGLIKFFVFQIKRRSISEKLVFKHGLDFQIKYNKGSFPDPSDLRWSQLSVKNVGDDGFCLLYG